MPDGKVWLYWDCVCGENHILGKEKECPKCGRPRTACYVDENAPDITDPEELATTGVGPDWTCSACGTINAHSQTTCRNCGGGKDDFGKDHLVIHYALGKEPNSSPGKQRYVPTPGWTTDSVPPAVRSTPEPARSTTSLRSTSTRRTRPNASGTPSSGGGFGCLAFVIVIAVVVGYFIFRPYNVDARVSGFHWERTITIQKYSWVADSNQSGFPAGSRNQRSAWEVVGNHQVQTGVDHKTRQASRRVADGEDCSYTDNGDGSASRSCTTRYTTEYYQEEYDVPVYETVDDYGMVYYFEIQRWVFARSLPTAGNDREPYWAEYTLATTGDPEREGGRSQLYQIIYTDSEGKTYIRNVDYDEWIGYNPNARYTLTLNSLGAILEVNRADG